MSARDPIFGFRIVEDETMLDDRIDFVAGNQIVGRIEMAEARDPIEAALDAQFSDPDGDVCSLRELMRLAFSYSGIESCDACARKAGEAAIDAFLQARADAYAAAGEHMSAGTVRGLIPGKRDEQR